MELCQAPDCDHHPIAICLHCREHLCIDHLLQHNEQLIYQANLYCDEFNKISEQIENMSCDAQFTAAEEDLNDWVNDQMKQLDKVFEEKLFELKEARSQVEEKMTQFKQMQRLKIINIQHRFFNAELSKQISPDQLNQMKIAIEKLRAELEHFKINQCSVQITNNDKINYSYKPNIDVQVRMNILDENEKPATKDNILHQEYKKTRKSQLRPDAEPFIYKSKEQNCDFLSPFRQKGFSNRLFD